MKKKSRGNKIKTEDTAEESSGSEINDNELSSDSEIAERGSDIDSMKNFEETNWLNDININDYGKLLQRHFEGKIFVFSSYFYSRLIEFGYDHVKRWMKNVDIFDMKFVFYPMFENSHWFLGIQNNLTNQLQLLDPYDPSYNIVLSSKNRMYAKDLEQMKNDRLKKIIHKHKSRLENIVNLFLKKHERYCDFQLDVLVPPSIPKQTNDNDCGVFLIEFMKFTSFEKEFSFTCENMPNFRQELIQEMTSNTILPITETGPPIYREGSTSTSTKQPSKRKSCDITSETEKDEKYEKKRKKVEIVSDFAINENRQEFHRRIVNKDSTSCWLNSCLQTLLVALDSCQNCPQFNSELGNQLLTMHSTSANVSLDPEIIRKLLTEADKSRIDSEIAEYTQEYENDPRELRRRIRHVNDLRLNLGTGQQCVRDFFLCLRENRLNWLDLYTFLNHNVVDVVKCSHCNRNSVGVTREQLYTEIDCPPDGTDLKTNVENNFHVGEEIEYRCEHGCKTQSLSMKRTALQDARNTNFLIIILRRATHDQGRQVIVTNNVQATDNVSLTDIDGCTAIFEPISVVQHSGVLKRDGTSSGHYTADIKNQTYQKWFRTSDNSIPQPISVKDVTKRGYVILYKNNTHKH